MTFLQWVKEQPKGYQYWLMLNAIFVLLGVGLWIGVYQMSEKNKQKSQAELEIEALADVFNLATTGFEAFYKEAKENAAKGDYSTAASSGDYSKAASSGDSSKAASSGDYSACAAVGYRAAVKGDKGNLLMASEYVKRDGIYIPIGGKADIVDGKKLKAGSWYIVENGKWVEVDFTDNVFSRVISNKSGVKKVKTDNGKVLFVVSDDKGNSAHGETIAKAREDLIYKAVAQFEGEIPKSATGKEWIGIYRAFTGACAAGVKNFVEGTGRSLDETYTSKEIANLVKGQFGAERFADKIKAV